MSKETTKTEIIKDVLPVKLTDEERMARADALANALTGIVEAKGRKKRIVKDLDRDIAVVEEEANELRDAVATGREYREVIVHRTMDWEKAIVMETRWETRKHTISHDFKINNNFCSRYARMIHDRNPHWGQVFELRKLKS